MIFNPFGAGIEFSRQNLTIKVDSLTVRVQIFLMAVDPYHRYSNETERDDKDNYDDFKSKKPFCLHRLYKICQRFEGYDLFVGAALTRVIVIEVLLR